MKLHRSYPPPPFDSSCMVMVGGAAASRSMITTLEGECVSLPSNFNHKNLGLDSEVVTALGQPMDADLVPHRIGPITSHT